MNDITKIAVITHDQQLAELCNTENIYLNCSVSVFSSIDYITEEFEVYFIDIDTVDQNLSFFDVSAVKMSRDKNKLKNEENYLVLPLSLREFENMLTKMRLKNNEAITCGENKNFILDKKNRMVYFGLKRASLSENELLVLEKLCLAEGSPVNREVLNGELGAEKGNEADVYICRLRNKFDKLCSNSVIKTVRLQGYRITVPVIIKNIY